MRVKETPRPPMNFFGKSDAKWQLRSWFSKFEAGIHVKFEFKIVVLTCNQSFSGFSAGGIVGTNNCMN